MAPRRPKRPDKEKNASYTPTDLETDKVQPLKQIARYAHNERVQFALGIVLLCFVLYTLIALLSFFFTGKADFSVLEQQWDTKAEMRNQIRNWGGLQGAEWTHFLLDSTFGLGSLSIILMLGIYGIALLRIRPVHAWKVFFHSVFWLWWVSVTLGFLQQTIGADSFFRWGGRHGELISGWLISYIQIIGVLLVLLATLLIFLVATNKNTIPFLQRSCIRFKNLFARKPKQETKATETEIADATDLTDTTDIPDIIDDSSPIDEEFTVQAGTVEEMATDGQEEQPTKTDDDTTPTNDVPDTDVSLEIKPTEEAELSEDDPDFLLKKLGPYDPRLDLSHFKFPSFNLLKTYDNETVPVVDRDEQNANKDRIVSTLRSYGIEITGISATVGPTVTLYEIVPKEGIKVARIKNLEDDIMLSLAASGIRIIAPMPGKGTVGIEVPNRKPQIVSMHSVVASKRFQEEQKMHLPVVMGKTITNEIFMFDLAKTPHLLVAGATGQGKSVGLNAIITSLLYKKHPSELKFVLVDPKMVEFTIYKDLLRHYMAAMPGQENPNDIIITDCTKVINTLNSLVIEMENRYKLLMEANCRNLEDYNEKFVNRRLNPEKGHRFLPYIVIIIDEFGDFIMQAGKEVERPIARITQKARAVGMHMILATQRPSVNIITGVIKANIPTRIAFRCQSIVDSRTVLDVKGAEGLVGRGDMLYSAGNGATRIQCAFVDTPEVIDIVKHIREQQGYTAPYELPEYVPEGGEAAPGSVDLKRLDPMFAEVARYVVQKQQGSTSVLQRKFQIGYNRAGKLSDQLEAAGIVGPNKGSKGRDVLVQDENTLEQILQSI